MNNCHPSIRSVLLPIHPLDSDANAVSIATDEGSASAERDSSPAQDTSYGGHPLPQGERGRSRTRAQSPAPYNAQRYLEIMARIRRDRLSRSNGLVIISMPGCRKPSAIATLSA